MAIILEQMGVSVAKGPRLVVSFQLKDDEVERFLRLEAAARARNRLYKRDALLREVVGLDNYGLVTPEELGYFRGSITGDVSADEAGAPLVRGRVLTGKTSRTPTAKRKRKSSLKS